jgi:hypothetical protein
MCNLELRLKENGISSARHLHAGRLGGAAGSSKGRAERREKEKLREKKRDHTWKVEQKTSQRELSSRGGLLWLYIVVRVL